MWTIRWLRALARQQNSALCPCPATLFRVLGGFSDELDLAVLSATTEHDNTFLSAALAMTLSHLATCVPLVRC